MNTPLERILVIKLSAFGDFVLSIAGFQAIRAHHPGAEITLLTTQPYRRMAEASGCFDRVWVDRRPAWWQAGGWFALRRQLASGRFQRVYDLQRSDRSGTYFRLLPAPKPEWVGTVAGCSHRYVPPPGPPAGKALHICEREAQQLALAGVPRPGLPDLSFLTADLRDVCGRTSLEALAALGREAVLAVGNDTGPMHLIAAAGAPSLVLYSKESDPAKIAPRGPAVKTLRRDDLSDLSLEEVLAALPASRRD